MFFYILSLFSIFVFLRDASISAAQQEIVYIKLLGKSLFKTSNILSDCDQVFKKVEESEIDFGQKNCLAHFYQQIEKKNLTDRALFVAATSEGTATILNWLAQLENKKNIKGVFLKSVMGSVNRDAIEYSLETPPDGVNVFLSAATKWCIYLPFSRFWIPIAVSLVLFKNYNPLKGNASLQSARTIKNTTFPIVLMHQVDCECLSINGAREMYAAWKENNNNVYLFEIGDANRSGPAFRCDVIEDWPEKKEFEMICAIQQIYKENSLAYSAQRLGDANPLDLKLYQPNPKEVLKKVNAQTWKRRWIRNAIDTTCALGIIALILKIQRNKFRLI